MEIALCNDRETPRRIPVNAWLFQTRLSVEAGGEEVFLPVADVLDRSTAGNPTTSCGGSICSTATGWSSRSGGPAPSTGTSPTARGRADRVWTTWLPDLRDPADHRGGDRRRAARHDRLSRGRRPAELRAGLRPIRRRVRGVARRSGRRRPRTLPEHLREDAEEVIAEPGRCSEQLAEGLDHAAGRPGGAALLPVHEPGDGGPAHPHPGRGAAQQGPEPVQR